MQLDASHRFEAPRERVWEAFNDPAVLARATPGCQQMEPVGPDEYAVSLAVGVAAVKGTYKGRLAIADKKPPEGYTLRVEGKGGPGFVKGTGHLTLTEDGGATLANIRGEGQVGGMLAAIGQRMAGTAAKMIMSQFFAAMDKEIGKPAAG